MCPGEMAELSKQIITMTESMIDEIVFNEIAELMGDSMTEFIETYLDNSPKLLNDLSRALPAGDMEVVIHCVHQLKGGSGSIGASQVFELARKMEEEARGGVINSLSSDFIELKAAYTQAETELKARL